MTCEEATVAKAAVTTATATAETAQRGQQATPPSKSTSSIQKEIRLQFPQDGP